MSNLKYTEGDLNEIKKKLFQQLDANLVTFKNNAMYEIEKSLDKECNEIKKAWDYTFDALVETMKGGYNG